MAASRNIKHLKVVEMEAAAASRVAEEAAIQQVEAEGLGSRERSARTAAARHPNAKQASPHKNAVLERLLAVCTLNPRICGSMHDVLSTLYP